MVINYFYKTCITILLYMPSLSLFGSHIPYIPEHLDIPCSATYGELLPLQPSLLKPSHSHKDIDPICIRGKILQQSLTDYIVEYGAIESDGLLLLADRIRYDKITNFLEASGNIRFESANFRLSCKQLKMDWKNKTGEALDLHFELPPNWVLLSNKVKFNNLTHWEFNKVELNPSFEKKPGWKALASKLKIDLERYAYFNNLWLWVFGLPTYYFLPYAILPARMQRTSGLLPVSISFGDKGAITIPYYKVLGDAVDITITPKYFFKKDMGIVLNLESRWNPEINHKGSTAVEYIRTGTKPYKGEYHLNFKEAWQREDGWQVLGDINCKSGGMLDCNYSNSDKFQFENRAYNSFASVSKLFPWGIANIGAARQKTYLFSKDDSTHDTLSVQRDIMPSMQYLFRPMAISSWYVDGNVRMDHLGCGSSLNNINRDDYYIVNRYNAFLRGTKSISNLVNIQVSSRITRYSASFNELSKDNIIPLQNSLHPSQRVVNSIKLELSSPIIGRKFNKINFVGNFWEVDHLLTPYTIFICTSSPKIKWHNPNFDNIDLQPGIDWSSEGEFSVEFGIKQHLLCRPNAGTSFLDLLRWKLSTKYNFNKIMLPNINFYKGWDSLNSDINFEINSKFRINLRKSLFASNNGNDDYVSAEYDVGDQARCNLALFSTKPDQSLIRQKGIQLGGLYRFYEDRVRLEFLCNYDYNQKSFTAAQIALACIQPCVAETLSFHRVSNRVSSRANRCIADENRVVFTIHLKNFGDVFKHHI